MKNLTDARPESPAAPASTTRRESAVVGIAAAIAALVWLAAEAAGVDLDVHAGSGSRPIGLVSVIVTVAVIAAGGAGLLRLLERRTSRALRVWTIVAVAVWVVSFAGPLSAMRLEGGLVLALLHLVVGAVVVGGLRSTRVA
jgi:hypothetical protein